ncbi:TPA: hypothetical protein ACHHIK_001691 [Staphylococcus aureus]
MKERGYIEQLWREEKYHVLFFEIHRFEIYINYAPNNLIRLYRKFPNFAYYLSNFTFILCTMHKNKRFPRSFH